MRAKGLGARVIVTEVDPVKALEAVMDGYEVQPMQNAAAVGDVFVTSTGDINVIDTHHMDVMKSGAMIANSGHFNVEINLDGLSEMAAEKFEGVNEHVQGYRMTDDRILYVLGEGRLINLAAAEGHPASVMDMSFANQALGAEYVLRNHDTMESRVYTIPEEVDREIARLKLEAMGVSFDTLTDQQVAYLNQWQHGT